MKHAGRWIALLGTGLALVLLWREGVGLVAERLRIGGYGLLAASLFHVVPMLLNARAWRSLMQRSARANLSTVFIATWLRESVNGLLPVARVGGEVVAYRLLLRRGLAHVPVAASLIVDLVLSLVSQSLFTLLGLALLIALGTDSRLTWQAALGFGVLSASGIGLMLFQGSSVGSRLLQAASRVLAGRWRHFLDQSAQLDRGIRSIYTARSALAACLAWQLLGWVTGACEVLIVLYALGRPPSIAEALVIEALIQMVGSVAFVVPGAVGVQEGSYLLIGAALGLDGPTSLALAAARRIRDVAVFFPGLLVCFWLEAARKGSGTPMAPRGSGSGY